MCMRKGWSFSDRISISRCTSWGACHGSCDRSWATPRGFWRKTPKSENWLHTKLRLCMDATAHQVTHQPADFALNLSLPRLAVDLFHALESILGPCLVVPHLMRSNAEKCGKSPETCGTNLCRLWSCDACITFKGSPLIQKVAT